MNGKNRWLPAEDDLLREMHKRGFPSSRIADRFGCSAADVDRRFEELQKLEEAKQVPANALPSEEELLRYRQTLEPVQLCVLDACTNFNGLGIQLRHLSELIDSRLSDVEFESVLEKCLAAPSKLRETLPQKLARLLTETCYIIPKPQQTGEDERPKEASTDS